MVQIRKGGGLLPKRSGILGGGVGSSSSSSSSKNTTSVTTIIPVKNAFIKLLLFLIICIQIVYLGYKVIIVFVIPKVLDHTTTTTTTILSSSSSSSSLSNTISSSNNKNNNIRHVSRTDIIKDTGSQQQESNHLNLQKDETSAAATIVQDTAKQKSVIQQKQQQQQQQQQDQAKVIPIIQRFGTGPAREGYVVDLIGERTLHLFNKQINQLNVAVQYIQSMIQTKHMVQVQSSNIIKSTATTTTTTTSIVPCEEYTDLSTTPSNTNEVSIVSILQKKNVCNVSQLQKQQKSKITDTKTELYGYSTVPFTRYYSTDICLHHHMDHNHKEKESLVPIPTGSVIPIQVVSNELSKDCNLDCFTHVFPIDITDVIQGNPNNINIPPIVIYDGSKTTTSDISTKTIECNIPCLYDTDLLGDIMNIPNPNDIIILGVKDTDWKIYQSLSDPYYNGNIKIERTNYRKNIYYSTTSFKSSVPLSFYDFQKYNIRNTKAIDYSTSNNYATYLLNTNCGLGLRHKWIAAVQVVMKVESFGECQHTTDIPPGGTIETVEGRLALMRRNRIVLAFEAGSDKDYITNVVWEALISGSVPAILGASNLDVHLPPNSAIYSKDYNSWDKFAAYINTVANNETLWNSYHKWRTDNDAISKFEHMYSFIRTTPECRICRWAYSKQYNMGFNHTTQQIQSPKLIRNLCLMKSSTVSTTKLIHNPFREVWYTNNQLPPSPTRDTTDCTMHFTSSNDNIEVNGYKFHRNVMAHDGIIDIIISNIIRPSVSSNEYLVLRFDIDNIQNTDGTYFRNVHSWVTESTRTPFMSSIAIQDEYSKVTIISNFITKLSSPAEGSIEIMIASSSKDDNGSIFDETTIDDIRRIRIIIEDTNVVHDKLTEYYPSTYARRMMHDFIDPIELYYTTTSSTT